MLYPITCPVCKYLIPSHMFQYHLQQCYHKARQYMMMRMMYQQQQQRHMNQPKPFIPTHHTIRPEVPRPIMSQVQQHAHVQTPRQLSSPMSSEISRQIPQEKTQVQQTEVQVQTPRRVPVPMSREIPRQTPRPMIQQQTQVQTQVQSQVQTQQQVPVPKSNEITEHETKTERRKRREQSLVPFTSRIPPPLESGVPLWQTEQFQSYVQGKRIVIVGPSDCNFSYRLGSWIDRQDIVVRLNKSLPVPPAYHDRIGSKTHLLYNNLNTTDFPGQNRLDALFLEKHNLHGVVSPYPSIEPFLKDIRKYSKYGSKQIPLRIMDVPFYQQVHSICESRPYTGVMAILDLLRYPIQSLFVTGMDFYHTGYYRGYREMDYAQKQHLRKNDIHDAEKQEHVLRWVYLRDHRFQADGVLKKILLQPWIQWMQHMKKKWDPVQSSMPSLTHILQSPFQCVFEHLNKTHMEQYIHMCVDRKATNYLWIPYSYEEQKKRIGLTPEQHVTNFEDAFRLIQKKAQTWWIPISSAHQWYYYHIFFTSLQEKGMDWPDGVVYYLYIGDIKHKDFQKMLELRDVKREKYITIPSFDRFYGSGGQRMSEYDSATLWLLLLFIWNIPDTNTNPYPIPSPFSETFNRADSLQHFMRAWCKLQVFQPI
jgi:hypothetical protein